MYITGVLIPAERWDEARPFLENNTLLNTTTVDKLLRQLQSIKHRLEEKAIDRIEVLKRETSVDNVHHGNVESVEPSDIPSGKHYQHQAYFICVL